MTAYTREWNESLCGCFDDCGSCCCGFWCTPCLFGQNAEKIDDSSCCLMCCAYSILSSCYLCWVPHYFKRHTLRQKFGLRAGSCGDFPATCCCSPCALCQEARFLKRSGNLPNAAVGATVMGSGPTVNQPYRNY